MIPFWPNGKPRWFKDESLALVSGLLVRFDLGESTREFALDDPTPFGASFGLRRSVVDMIGDFRRDLGVTGGIPGRGEESEYLRRVLAAGFSGVYVGEGSVHHWTDSRRLKFGYLYRYGVQTGIAEKLTGSAAVGSSVQAVVFAARGCLQLLRGRRDRFCQCVINVGIQIGLQSKSNAS